VWIVAVFAGTLLSVPAAAVQAEDCPSTGMCLPSFDYDSDGHQDLVAVRKSDGNLLFYAGRGDGTYERGISRGADWGRMEIVMAGDLTGDGNSDLLGRDNRTGYLYTYPGDGSGDFRPRITVGPGWNSMGLFTTSIVLSGGRIDLYAVSRDQSTLYRYPGLNDGRFGTRNVIVEGGGWNTQNILTTLGVGLLAVDGETGRYGFHDGSGDGDFAAFAPRVWLNFWSGSSDDQYRQVADVGDADDDGLADLAGIDSRTNELVLNSFDGQGRAMHAPEVAATGWGGGNRLPSVVIARMSDFDANNFADIVARQELTGEVRVYQTDGMGAWANRDIAPWGNFSDMNVMEKAGDLNGDGFADLITRASASGALYLYPGDGDGTLGARVQIGSSWNEMSAIASGYDFDVDGKVDVVAREKSTGDLWLYPGDGNGALRPRVKIGTGWNTLREITAAGDLDHDGHPDILAIHKTDGCLYFFGGKGTGGVKNSVKVGCGWEGMDVLAAIGDMNLDGHIDFLARRASDGHLLLYRGTGTGSFRPVVDVSGGFGAKDILA